MKSLLLISVLAFASLSVRAQLWNELFRQKKTQIKYSLKQIAALKIYASYIKQGYRIVQDGLTFIGDVENGHFQLDGKYFNSLSNVSPSIKKDLRIKDIEMYARGAMTLSVSGKRQVEVNSPLTNMDKATIINMFNNAVADCTVITTELSDIITSGELELTDNNRLTRITNLLDRAEGLFHFVQHFSASVQFYQAQVKNEKRGIIGFSKWYGIK